MERSILFIAAFIFLFVSIAHLVRIVFQWEITVGGFHVPMFVSGAGFIIAFALALGIFKAANKETRK